VERGSQRRAAVKGARREGRGEASLDGEHRCEIIHARKEKASFLALAPTKKSEFPRKDRQFGERLSSPFSQHIGEGQLQQAKQCSGHLKVM
jgi:hypothetical protein